MSGPDHHYKCPKCNVRMKNTTSFLRDADPMEIVTCSLTDCFTFECSYCGFGFVESVDGMIATALIEEEILN